jgi:hypothetical protein
MIFVKMRVFSGFKNLLPRPIQIIKDPKKFYNCPNCHYQFEKLTEYMEHMKHRNCLPKMDG